MTDQQLNERLAKALGFHYSVCDDGTGMISDSQYGTEFSPATFVADLRKWVLPEIKLRGLTGEFNEIVGRAAMSSYADPEAFDILSCEPAVISAAALQALEADNAG